MMELEMNTDRLKAFFFNHYTIPHCAGRTMNSSIFGRNLLSSFRLVGGFLCSNYYVSYRWASTLVGLAPWWMHVLFACLTAMKTKVSPVNQTEAGRRKPCLGLWVGCETQVFKSSISGMCTSLLNSPDKGRPKEARPTKSTSEPVNKKGLPAKDTS